MTSRFHMPNFFGKSSARITRLRIRMFAQASRNIGAVMFGLCAGWMVMTLAFSWNLALGAAVGLALFLLGYVLIPIYVEPDSEL